MVDPAVRQWEGFRSLGTTGSDPEVFVTAGGKLLPAWEFLPSKEKVGTLDEYTVAPFWDGFQAEFNTTTNLNHCIAYVVDDIQKGLSHVLDAARKVQRTAKLTIQNVFQIPIATLRKEADEHVILGCDPSINAYYMSGNFPGDGRELRYRFAGGHIHLGGVATELVAKSKDRTEVAIPTVKALDAILGVWAVGAAAGIDNPVRRKYYGLAGEFRLPKHGLEYRTLSNFWLTHPAISNLVLTFARGVARFEQAGLMRFWAAHEQETVETINNCDVQRARRILKLNEDVLSHVLSGSWHYGSYAAGQFLQDTVVSQAVRVGQNGIESVVKDPDALEENWKLMSHYMHHSDGKNENWRNASAYASLGQYL